VAASLAISTSALAAYVGSTSVACVLSSFSACTMTNVCECTTRVSRASVAAVAASGPKSRHARRTPPSVTWYSVFGRLTLLRR
jgi:hypothetical protein